MREVIEFPSPPARRLGFVGLPQARIEVASMKDGRWCWGMSFTLSRGGEGFAALPKWKHYADSQQDAVEDAASYMIEKLRHHWRGTRGADQLIAWARSMADPDKMTVQMALLP